MRFLVISDTHGNQAAIFKAYQAAGKIDAVLHLGDGETDVALLAEVENCPVLRVAGNCDLGSKAPSELIAEWRGVRILLCHGDRYGVKAGLSQLIGHGLEAGVQAVLYGHTHLAMAEERDGLMLLNPGTMTNQATFHSFAILEISVDGLHAKIHPL